MNNPVYSSHLCLHDVDTELSPFFFICIERWIVISESTASTMGQSNILLILKHLPSNDLEIRVRTRG